MATIYAKMRGHGFVLSPAERLSDAIAGNWRKSAGILAKAPTAHIIRGNNDKTISLPDSTAGWDFVRLDAASLSGDGASALIPMVPRISPRGWSEYRNKQFRSQFDGGFRYGMWVVVNLRTGSSY